MIKFNSSENKTGRLIKRCVVCLSFYSTLLLAPAMSLGQITITAKDMFSKEGQYYKMYSNFGGHFSDATREEVDVFEYIVRRGRIRHGIFGKGRRRRL